MRLWRTTKHENGVHRASHVETYRSVIQASGVGTAKPERCRCANEAWSLKDQLVLREVDRALAKEGKGDDAIKVKLVKTIPCTDDCPVLHHRPNSHFWG
jgi:hypothetical protein